MSTAQPALFDARPVDPFVAEQRAILDDVNADPVALVTAALRLHGYATGPGGDPHMMGHRAGPAARSVVEALTAHGIVLARAPQSSASDNALRTASA